MVLWLIFAAIIGVALHLIVNQLSGTGWSWKTFFISFIPLAVTAAGSAIAYVITGNFVADFVGALIGGFMLSTGITLALANKAINNKVDVMQGRLSQGDTPIPKK